MTRLWRIVSMRLRAIFRRNSAEREMQMEMADHVASEIEELVRRGMTAEQARLEACRTMGRLDVIQEECRDARGVIWWDNLRQDTACAFRLLLRNKTYASLAVTTIAVGIGSVSAVFSVADAVLVRPLPYREPEKLISVEGIGMRGPFDTMRVTSKVADYAGYQGVRAYNLVPDGGVPERIKGSEVSANFFTVLGVDPVAGRVFHEGEDRPGAPRTVVLSHSFWMQRYGGRTDVLGRHLVLDEVAYAIAGVMPEGFHFPSSEVQVWTPMVLDPRSAGAYWGIGGTGIFARLRPGGTLDSAREELRVQVPRIRAMFPWRMPDAWGRAVKVAGLQDALVASARTRGWMLMGVAAVVLLMAVVNVANLMIGSTTARAREFALRTSIGATPGRLARQLLTESVVLTGVGGIAGLIAGYGQLALLRWLLPADTPRLAEVAMDGRVMLFTATVSVLSGILVGLWPAWRARSRRSLVVTGSAMTSRRLRAAGVLVMTEAAFATVLLVGSGLLLRSLWTMLQVDTGFQVDSIVTAEFSPSRSAAKRTTLWEEVRIRLLAHPGVREVAAMNVLPLSTQVSTFAVAIEDRPLPPEQPQYVLWSTSVTPEHADVLGVRLVEGRKFTAADRAGSDPVVIVSKSTAERFWPGRSPVGRRLKPVSNRAWRTIVGVVDDVKNYSLAGLPEWAHGDMYVPMAQSTDTAGPVSLVVRVQGDRRTFETALPGLVHEVCTTCAVSKIASMEEVVARAVETPRSTAWLVTGFTILALGLAAAGIYGVVNHTVVRRTRELGVRLALGSGPGRVVALVAGSSFVQVAAGCTVGLVLAWLLGRLVRSLLFGIAPHDMLSFAAAPALLLVVTLAATAVPAFRALRIDPADCLREG